MSTWRVVNFDEQHGGPGLWFHICPTCPIYPIKVAEPGQNDRRMACMGGPREGDRLGVFTVCWHTDKNAVRRVGLDNHWEVECRFNPETDLWNRPGGKIGANYVPPPLLSEGEAGEPLGTVLQRLFRGSALKEKPDP